MFKQNLGLDDLPVSTAGDGMGQNIWMELRWWLRFRRVRSLNIPWQTPEPSVGAHLSRYRQIQRFGDATVAMADFEGKVWIVRERDWYGFPDPSRYVVFALDGNALWLAMDFDLWPQGWLKPEALDSLRAE